MIAKLRIWEYCKMFTDDGALSTFKQNTSAHLAALVFLPPQKNEDKSK